MDNYITYGTHNKPTNIPNTGAVSSGEKSDHILSYRTSTTKEQLIIIIAKEQQSNHGLHTKVHTKTSTLSQKHVE